MCVKSVLTSLFFVFKAAIDLRLDLSSAKVTFVIISGNKMSIFYKV